jgi:hypothetical protein
MPAVIIRKYRDGCTMTRKAGACLSLRRAVFDLRPVSVEFMVDEVAEGQVSLRLLLFSPFSIISLLLHTLPLIYHRRYIKLETNSGHHVTHLK